MNTFIGRNRLSCGDEDASEKGNGNSINQRILGCVSQSFQGFSYLYLNAFKNISLDPSDLDRMQIHILLNLNFIFMPQSIHIKFEMF